MFAYLKGILIGATPTEVVLEVNGVGYCLFTSCKTLEQLPAMGSQIQFFTSFVVRELSQALYGFLDANEKELFEILLDISGIGPKLALSIIGHLSIHQLNAAVNEKNLPLLCKVPGIGKKTAERIIIELRDKLAHLALPSFAEAAITLPQNSHNQHLQDAMMALINLGYTQHIAKKAIELSLKELPEKPDLALLITHALKNSR